MMFLQWKEKDSDDSISVPMKSLETSVIISKSTLQKKRAKTLL
jgi:hypothetical protein